MSVASASNGGVMEVTGEDWEEKIATLRLDPGLKVKLTSAVECVIKSRPPRNRPGITDEQFNEISRAVFCIKIDGTTYLVHTDDRDRLYLQYQQ